MKKSTRLETLKLKTETVTTLTQRQLAKVVGGMPRERTLGETCSCLGCGASDACE